jgi:hypothetical protein
MLHDWAGKMRLFYKRKCLPEEQINRLNEIQFSWDTKNQPRDLPQKKPSTGGTISVTHSALSDKRWKVMHQKMLEYKAEVGSQLNI